MTGLDYLKAGSQSTHKESGAAIQRMIFVVWLVFGFLFNAAHATTGLDYLSAQQNPDGSFGNTATSLATPVQSTAEVLRAYQALGQQAQPLYTPALGYLNSDTEANTEFLARKILVNAKAGNDVTALINTLIANQNADGYQHAHEYADEHVHADQHRDQHGDGGDHDQRSCPGQQH